MFHHTMLAFNTLFDPDMLSILVQFFIFPVRFLQLFRDFFTQHFQYVRQKSKYRFGASEEEIISNELRFSANMFQEN